MFFLLHLSSFLPWGNQCYQFLMYHSRIFYTCKDGWWHAVLHLAVFNLHLLWRSDKACQNMVSLFVTKSFLNSKDNIQNILSILQTALRFIFPSVITSIFFFWSVLLICSAGSKSKPGPSQFSSFLFLCLYLELMPLAVCMGGCSFLRLQFKYWVFRKAF